MLELFKSCVKSCTTIISHMYMLQYFKDCKYSSGSVPPTYVQCVFFFLENFDVGLLLLFCVTCIACNPFTLDLAKKSKRKEG
jgi:hypothetical protein